MKVDFVVLQNGTREVFRGDTWEKAIQYLKTVKDIYEESYRVCLNERDGSLTIQDEYTLEFLVDLCIRTDDAHGSIYSRIANQILSKGG